MTQWEEYQDYFIQRDLLRSLHRLHLIAVQDYGIVAGELMSKFFRVK